MKEKIEDTKGIINSRKLKKDREYNAQKKQYNNVRNIRQKTKDRA